MSPSILCLNSFRTKTSTAEKEMCMSVYVIKISYTHTHICMKEQRGTVPDMKALINLLRNELQGFPQWSQECLSLHTYHDETSHHCEPTQEALEVTSLTEGDYCPEVWGTLWDHRGHSTMFRGRNQKWKMRGNKVDWGGTSMDKNKGIRQ